MTPTRTSRARAVILVFALCTPVWLGALSIISLRKAGQKVAADVVTVDEPIPAKLETPKLALRKFSWEVE